MLRMKRLLAGLLAACLLGACDPAQAPESPVLPPAQAEKESPTHTLEDIAAGANVDMPALAIMPRFELDGAVMTVTPFSPEIAGNVESILRLETASGAAYEWTGIAAYDWFVEGDPNGTRGVTTPVCMTVVGADRAAYLFFTYQIVNGMQAESAACLLLREEGNALTLIHDIKALEVDADILSVEGTTRDLTEADDPDAPPQDHPVLTYMQSDTEMALPIAAQVDVLVECFDALLGEDSEKNQHMYTVTYRVRGDSIGLADADFVTPDAGSEPSLAIEGWGYGKRFDFCGVRDLNHDGADELLLQTVLSLGYRGTECHVFTVFTIGAGGGLMPAWAKAMGKQEAEEFLPEFCGAEDWFQK